MSEKKESTHVKDLFTINLDNLDEGKVPGVTMLLNPKKMEADAARKEKANPTSAIQTNTAPKTWNELGVGFQLTFQKENSGYRYSKATSHDASALPAWQAEVLNRMKLVSSVFSATSNFHEFSAPSNLFALDAFGAPATAFVQLVQVTQDEWTVLISKASLLKHKDVVIALLSEGSSKNDSIELDFAS